MSQLVTAHSPNLNTVIMVETSIQNAQQAITVAELKRRLPKQVNHNTLKVILRYLQESGKIEFTPDGILWIFSRDLDALLKKGRTWT
ncbi:MAG: hypothetical protein OXR66_06220 [Candidatus Woesearchaeota archaeon]|nr:hypothetical protein [Candidatus Woesearchaeota archaeon]